MEQPRRSSRLQLRVRYSSSLERLVGRDLIGLVCEALPIWDLFCLQQTNKWFRDVTAASSQWDMAANALEAEFPLSQDEEGVNEWREEHDPRAATAAAEWHALPPQRRFAAMVPLCRRLVADLRTAAAIVGERYFNGFHLNASQGNDEVSVRHEQVYATFEASGHAEDVAMLTAQSFFEHELRNAKSNGDLAHDVEGMLVDDESFPGGSSGRDAINEMYYPPLYAELSMPLNEGDFSILPGSTKHVEMLLHPPLPFSEAERRLLGAMLVDSMRTELEAPSWHEAVSEEEVLPLY
jgi:hypothetical protein